MAQWLCWIGVAPGAKTKQICLVPWVLGPIGRMELFQLRQENPFPVPNRDPSRQNHPYKIMIYSDGGDYDGDWLSSMPLGHCDGVPKMMESHPNHYDGDLV